MTATAAPEAPASFAGHGTKAYRAYVLGAFVMVYSCSLIDRVSIAVIQEPIKQEFGLSDFQLGLLGGPAFAIFYAVLGIPIARLAEHFNRVTLLSICVGLWSAMTVFCGLAMNYAQLLIARVGVSVGEAGGGPTSQSVIADYFPAERRTSAMSIYALGIPIGAFTAAVGGAWIANEYGWREAFIFMGAPGILLAIIVKLTVREPPRAASKAAVPTLGEAAKLLWKSQAFRHIAMGAAVLHFASYAIGQYLPSFFIRTHELSVFEAGLTKGLVMGACAGIGTFLSGFLVDRLSKRHAHAISWIPALGLGLSVPFYAAALLSGAFSVAVGFLVFATIFAYFFPGPMYAATHGIVPARMRATAVAVLLLIISLLGYGLGPPTIGAISDLFASARLAETGLSLEGCKALRNDPACAGGLAHGLQWALIVCACMYIWAAAHFLLSARTLRKEWVG